MSSTSRPALGHPVLRVAFFLVAYFAILLAMSVPKGMVPARFADLTWGALSSLGILALTAWMLRREGRSGREVGLQPDRGSAGRLIIGLALGVLVYAVTVGVDSLLLGPIRFEPLPPPSAAQWIVVLAGFLALSCMEELGFRGYTLRTLIPTLGHWPAQVLTALLFGLGHLAFGWSWSSVLLGVVPSALLFGVVAVRSRGLAMPIGVHAAVNIASWTIGAKDTAGLWAPNVDPANTARMTSYAPFVGLAVTLLAAAALSRGRRDTTAAGTTARPSRS